MFVSSHSVTVPSTRPYHPLTLEDTLVLQLIGGAPALEKLIKLGPISSALWLEVVTLVDDSTLLCGRSGNDAGCDIVGLLVSLTSDGSSGVEGGDTGSLGLRGKVLRGW